MTVDQVIIRWLQARPLTVVTSSQIETHLPNFGMTQFNVVHTPATYARIFRKMKRTDVFKNHGLTLTEERKGTQKIWRIILN